MSPRFKAGSLTKMSRKVARHIVEINPRFERVIELSGICPLFGKEQITKRKESNFAALASSILSQQLSTKAAATIIGRVEALSGGSLQAAKIAKLSTQTLRAAGCSKSKARAITELAIACANKEIPISALHRLDDESIMKHLLPRFGIGQWTVEMFLMFQLGRADIWPVGDLGVRRGWEKIHGMSDEITPKQLQELGEAFSPYRSHVAWYCWRAVEVL